MPNPCGTTFPVAPGTTDVRVRYRPARGETYLYCNNPEQINRPGYLGDRVLGDVALLRSAADGACFTWYEHVNRLGRPIGYAVQASNETGRALRIAVTGLGFGTDPFTPWLQLSGRASGGGGRVGRFPLPPGGALWLQRNDGIADGQVFNGAVRFRVEGGAACIRWYAYERFERIGPCPGYLGWVRTPDPPPFPQDEARVYKGAARARGRDAPGVYRLCAGLRLDVSRLVRGPATWISHWCPSGASDVQDVVIPTRGPAAPCAARVSCLTGDNLANWGVSYDYRLRLDNDTGANRRLHLLVSQFRPGVASNVVVATAGGLAGCSIGSGPGTSGTTWDFHDFDLAAGQARTVRWQLVLGASSGGELTNQVAAD